MSPLNNHMQIDECILPKKKTITEYTYKSDYSLWYFCSLVRYLCFKKKGYSKLEKWQKYQIDGFFWFIYILEDFAHVFTEYGNCFTFNHGETLQAKRKVSVSGRGLNLLFNVNQVLNFLQVQDKRECVGVSKTWSDYWAISDSSHTLDIISVFVNLV